MIVRHKNKRINLENVLVWELDIDNELKKPEYKHTIIFYGFTGECAHIKFKTAEEAKKVMANIDLALMQQSAKKPTISLVQDIPKMKLN